MRNSKHLDILRAIGALGCVLMLSACGGLQLTVVSPYYYSKTSTGEYKLRLKVENGSNVTIDSVKASVNGGQLSPEDPTAETREFKVQQGSAKGLQVAYEVKYTAPGYWLGIPQQFVRNYPTAGALQIPILDPDSDIDGDGIPDRLDDCPFHPERAACEPQTPGLKRIVASQTVEMHDNRGNRMLTAPNNVRYYAFMTLVKSQGNVTKLSVDGTPDNLGNSDNFHPTVELADCHLVYQDGDGGVGGYFVEVYAAAEPGPDHPDIDRSYNCSFAMKNGALNLITGSEVFIVVVTEVSSGTAGVFGRVTLQQPSQEAPAEPGQQPSPAAIVATEAALKIFHSLTVNSSANYAYFAIDRLNPLQVVQYPGQDMRNTATYSGEAMFLFRP